MGTKKGIYPCVKCEKSMFEKTIAPKLKKMGYKIAGITRNWDTYPIVKTYFGGATDVVGNYYEIYPEYGQYLCRTIPEFLAAVEALAIERGWFKEEVISKEETTTEPLEELMSATSAFMKQARIDNRYMAMAYIWAGSSYCERRKVGALIVKDKMIISDGYNGTPSGFPNVCENEEGSTLSYVLHAEANAITKVAKSTNNCEGATLYVTTSPCIECSKLIIQAGIRRVVYCEEYRNTEGIDLLKQAGIKVDQIDKKEIRCQVDAIFKE